MSKVQVLRCLVNERLTAAAEEIFALFERTIAEYEEELCRSKEENQRKQQLLDSVSGRARVEEAGVQIQSPEEIRTCLTEINPDPPQFTEELTCSKHEGPSLSSVSLDCEDSVGEEWGDETELSNANDDQQMINSDISDDDDWTQNSADEIMETGDNSNAGTAEEGTIWELVPPDVTSTTDQLTFPNVVSPSPTFHARTNVTDPQSAFLCLLDVQTLQHICECTAAEARSSNPGSSWDLSVPELKAFLSLLFAQTTFNKHVPVEGLWSDEWGLPFFGSTMPRKRFREIMRYLSLEKKDQRQDYSDVFAPIVDVWSAFVANCGACFTPGANLALGEYILPNQNFFVHSKTRDEITFCMLLDVDTKYFLNGFPYCGKDFEPSMNKNLACDVVMKLTQPYLGNGRNITVKSKFTSLSLAQNLLKHNTTLVGAVNASGSELPKGARERRDLYDTQLFRCEDATLTVYQGQTHRSIAVLSTMHRTARILDTCKRQPHTLNFYNHTKTAVASLEQMSRPFSVKRKTRKWTVAVLYHLLDLAATNAWILLQKCTSSAPVSLHRFVLQLASDLRADLRALKHRPRAVNFCEPLEHAPNRRRRCRINHKCKQNKTSLCCSVCVRPVCGKCVARVDNYCPLCLKH